MPLGASLNVPTPAGDSGIVREGFQGHLNRVYKSLRVKFFPLWPLCFHDNHKRAEQFWHSRNPRHCAICARFENLVPTLHIKNWIIASKYSGTLSFSSCNMMHHHIVLTSSIKRTRPVLLNWHHKILFPFFDLSAFMLFTLFDIFLLEKELHMNELIISSNNYLPLASHLCNQTSCTALCCRADVLTFSHYCLWLKDWRL